MEADGIGFSPLEIEACRQLLIERQQQLEEEAHNLLPGAPFSLSSPKQVAGLLYDRLKLTSSRSTRATDVRTLKSLMPKHMFVDILLGRCFIK